MQNLIQQKTANLLFHRLAVLHRSYLISNSSVLIPSICNSALAILS